MKAVVRKGNNSRVLWESRASPRRRPSPWAQGSCQWSVGSPGHHRVNLTAGKKKKKIKAFHPPKGNQTISAGAFYELSHPGVSLWLRIG